MSGIRVVAHVVRCAADLLLCNDIDTDALRFADAEACRSSLPAIIGDFQRVSAPGEVVMGRCRFQLDRAPAAGASPAQQPQRITGIGVANVGGSIAPTAP